MNKDESSERKIGRFKKRRSIPRGRADKGAGLKPRFHPGSRRIEENT
jgi:hypothetical protein